MLTAWQVYTYYGELPVCVQNAFHPESKSAKKNKKRKAGKKSSSNSTPFEIEEDVSAPVATPTPDDSPLSQPPPSSQPPPIDPIAKLRKQIEEAKAAKVGLVIRVEVHFFKWPDACLIWSVG